MLTCSWLLVNLALAAAPGDATTRPSADPRNVHNGWVIPDEGYCDQPYIVIRPDGAWVCTMTTGKGEEGHRGQHVVSTISTDQGRTWSPLVDIEPADGPEASWVIPLITPGGRIYAFYDYNGDRVNTLGEKKDIRADMLGWYVYKYSDDGGQSWSKERYRLPVRVTACDRTNDWGGKVQILWGICKPIVSQDTAFFSFTKLGRYLLDEGEGWLFASDNILTARNPADIRWEMLPEGDHGIRAPEFGSVQEEHNIVALSNGDLYCVYRTTTGHPCHSYSCDRGRTWSKPKHMTYTPGGRKIKTPRACPRVWRTSNGKYLFWFHNHSGKTFQDRNPAWLAGGVERDGYIHWSQPEILLYDPKIDTRMSYPDLIEQDGRYWITETQKEVARVHEIDASLLEGLWNQDSDRRVPTRGLVLDWKADDAGEQDMPRLPDLRSEGGLSIHLRFRLDNLAANQVILDTHDESGKGIAVVTTKLSTLAIQLSDGTTSATWDCDSGLLKAGRTHHVTIIVDGGPKIITFVVDGQLCDGGETRQYGWGRFSNQLGDVNGGRLKIAPSLSGRLERVRIYNRYLRTSEAVALAQASD
ncbi:MAG TPA: exo-alpha-sialidase [Phycisphaerae bacterium]|jgi:hypothetical protein|nr:hypothetical protein [Phycisphaerae bacterium]HOB75826.1 exo-alpha-sialidase [Phycisphaerae bacterium]HOJ54547.1 exo-alpha-sialidase [Phycisphaerae bacterium]HOL27060.1 exo-alpha-sialidase [Phycisphaerae bacterium]HPP22142.1 exo-alpha-sialidase [Phycisphaerae bacterium]